MRWLVLAAIAVAVGAILVLALSSNGQTREMAASATPSGSWVPLDMRAPTTTVGKPAPVEKALSRDEPAPRSAPAPVARSAPSSTTPVAPAPLPKTPSPSGWTWPWSCIASHEGFPPGNPATDTGNGYYGGLQFALSTWQAYGGTGNPAAASIGEQEAVGARVLAAQGWGAWPVSSRRCGL